jgi:Restriction endonuclease S subunits
MLAMFEMAPAEWERTTLGKIVERGGGSIQTGPFGSQLHASDYVPVGIPSIMPVNIGDNRLIRDGIACITEADAQRLSRHIVRKGDIIYSRRGDVERRALVRDAEDGWFCGTGCLKVRLGQGVVRPEFAAFYLGHPEVREWIVRHAVGATMPNLNTGIMEAIPFLLPSASEQDAIAETLSALDDKIEQNRRTGRALEELARATFKAWFVDFEPVKAKAAGATGFPGMPPAAFAALPDRLTDSALGPVPEGWEVLPIGNLVTVKGGGTPSTKVAEYWDGGTHFWATPKDLSGLQDPVLLGTERRITDAGARCISSGVLPENTVLLSSRAPVGYTALARVPVAVNQGFIAMSCDGPLPPHYVLHWTRSALDEIKSRASGTTFPEISKSAFRPIPAVLPNAVVVQEFERFVQPLFDLIESDVRQSRQLAELRDYLLPRLLSGRVRVAGAGTDAERAAAEAVA